jgi:predicted metal-dependent enzyme (double-stranded beta helix superfamily)
VDTVDRFIQSIREASSQADAQGSVENTLQHALDAWAGPPPWLGPPAKPEFSVLYEAADLTILHIVWPGHLMTEAHDHGMWATIGIYQGRENNIIWRRDGNSIVADDAQTIGMGQVHSLPGDAIHSVTNPLGQFTGAIHVYGGDFMGTLHSEWDPEHLSERPRDMRKAMQAFQETALSAE